MNNYRNRRKNKTKMSRKKLITILIIVDAALLLAILGTAYIFRADIAGIIAGKNLENEVGLDTGTPWGGKDETDAPSWTEDPLLRDKQSRNILFIGKDDIALNTDVMMLINVNRSKNKISVMQIPRDTFYTYKNSPVKFNSIFARIMGMQKSTGDETQDKMNALEEFRSVLADALSITIDYYAMIDLDGLEKIVDTIGGVPMYVPYNMKYTDPGQNLYINISQGQQTLTGAQARQYVRFRSGFVEADVGRQDSQKLFLVAFLRQFRAEFTLSNIGDIVKQLDKYLITSMTDDQMTTLALAGYSMDLEKINIFSAPGIPLSPKEYYNGVSYMILNRGALYTVINEHFNMINTDIPEEEFDKDRNFTLLNNYTINAYYNRTLEAVKIYSAEDIAENGIDIQLKNY